MLAGRTSPARRCCTPCEPPVGRESRQRDRDPLERQGFSQVARSARVLMGRSWGIGDTHRPRDADDFGAPTDHAASCASCGHPPTTRLVAPVDDFGTPTDLGTGLVVRQLWTPTDHAAGWGLVGRIRDTHRPRDGAGCAPVGGEFGTPTDTARQPPDSPGSPPWLVVDTHRQPPTSEDQLRPAAHGQTSNCRSPWADRCRRLRVRSPRHLPLRLSRNTLLRPRPRVPAMPDPASTTPVRLPLSVLKPGDRAVVQLGGLSGEESALLEAMGLRDQSEIRICRSGSPCIIEVAHTRLGLAASVACRIFTTPCGAACPAVNEASDRTPGV